MPLQLLSRPTDTTCPRSPSTVTTPAPMHSIPTIHLVAANPGLANSIKLGNKRMIRVKHDGLLERQNLENTVLTGDREEDLVSSSFAMRMLVLLIQVLVHIPVFTRPSRAMTPMMMTKMNTQISIREYISFIVRGAGQ